MNSTNCHSTIRQYLCSGALALATIAISGNTVARPVAQTPQVSIATQLTEVQRGTFGGRDYLTLNIGGHEVGPVTCRSNVLRMETTSVGGSGRQEQIETVALSAMLSSTLVMIVVPMGSTECVDGKPTFTDLYFLPVSP